MNKKIEDVFDLPPMEKEYEDEPIQQEETGLDLAQLQQQLDVADKRLKEIDEKDLFKSDDEIGWFFKNLKGLQNDLSKFKINQ